MYPATGVSTASVQPPSLSARQVIVCPFHEGVTRTSASGAAVPHSFTSVCCWSIMLSPTSAGSFTLAPNEAAPHNRINARTLLFIVYLYLTLYSESITRAKIRLFCSRSPFHVQKVGVFAHVLKQNYTLMYYTLMYNLYICH